MWGEIIWPATIIPMVGWSSLATYSRFSMWRASSGIVVSDRVYLPRTHWHTTSDFQTRYLHPRWFELACFFGPSCLFLGIGLKLYLYALFSCVFGSFGSLVFAPLATHPLGPFYEKTLVESVVCSHGFCQMLVKQPRNTRQDDWQIYKDGTSQHVWFLFRILDVFFYILF